MVERIRNEIKRLESENISVLDLKIVYEIDCQLENEISDSQYSNLKANVEWAYLKLEGVPLESIVRCGIENLDKLDDENFDFREECCHY